MSEIPKQISNAIRSEAVKQIFKGYPRDSIAKNMKVSTGAVSNIWKRFKRDAIRMGYDKVKTEYGISEELDGLRILSTEINKAKLTIPQAYAGVQLLNKLRSLGVDESTLESFITNLYNKSKEAGYSPEKLVEYALKLSKLEAEYKLDYPSILTSFSEKKSEKDRLEIRIKELNSETSKVQEQRDKAINDFTITNEALNEYRQVRDELVTYGIEVRETKRLATVMRNAKELGFSPERIILYIKENENFSQQKAKLQSEIDWLQKDKTVVNTQKEELTKKLNELDEQITKSNKILEDLHGKVTDISKKIQEENENYKAIQNSIEDADAAIKNIESKVAENVYLNVFTLLIDNPKTQLEPIILFKISLALFESLKVNLEINPRIVTYAPSFKQKLEEIDRTLGVELRRAI